MSLKLRNPLDPIRHISETFKNPLKALPFETKSGNGELGALGQKSATSAPPGPPPPAPPPPAAATENARRFTSSILPRKTRRSTLLTASSEYGGGTHKSLLGTPIV